MSQAVTPIVTFLPQSGLRKHRNRELNNLRVVVPSPCKEIHSSRGGGGKGTRSLGVKKSNNKKTVGLQFHNHQLIDYNSCYYSYQRFSHMNEEHVITVFGGAS